jgi:hypothetical protein
MKLKSFKRFLKEEDDKNSLNSFIENTFEGNWGKTKTDFGNFIETYSCKDSDVLYRIIFFPKTEIEQLTRLSDLKQKLKSFLTTENQGHPRFYTKDDYHRIPDHLSFLAGLGQKIHGYTDDNSETNYMGIIISKKGATNDNVDFSHYDGKIGNKEIASRIDTTKPVLSVNDPSTVKVVAGFEFEQGTGWTINDLDKTLEDNIGNSDEVELPDTTTTPEEEEQENETK